MRNKLMSTTSIATIALATGLATTAFSPTAIADGYEPVGKGYAPAPVVNRWGGFNIGLHAGAGAVNWGGCWDCTGTDNIAADRLSYDGVLGGVHGGYNWQFGRIVAGL